MEAVYSCSNCGHESPFYLTECPACGRGFFNLKSAGGVRQTFGAATAAVSSPEGPARVCYKCDFETREASGRCPRCGGRRLMTTTGVRALGAVLVGLGLFLMVFMGAIAVVVTGIIAGSNRPGSTTRFTGGTKELALIYGIFGLVIAFGAASTVGGALQLARGRRSKTMVRVVLGIFIALVVVCELVYIILD